MKNTKFRKRALLSSVAMLLVALVALGSATFAWFVDDPNADATGIKAQANTAIGLLARTTTDSTWSHHASLYKNINDDSILVPATTINGTAYWTAKAAVSSASGIKTGDATSKWDTVTVANVGTRTSGGVYHEKITLKVTGGTNASDVKLTSVDLDTSDDAMADAVTVLIMKGSSIVGEWNKGSAGHTSIAKWSTLTASTQTTAANGSAVDAKATGSAQNISLGALNSGSTMEIDVYVYLNGADSSVYTEAASATTLLNSIKVNFTAVK